MRGERGLPGKREGLQTINMLISLCSPPGGANDTRMTPACVFSTTTFRSRRRFGLCGVTTEEEHRFKFGRGSVFSGLFKEGTQKLTGLSGRDDFQRPL